MAVAARWRCHGLQAASVPGPCRRQAACQHARAVGRANELRQPAGPACHCVQRPLRFEELHSNGVQGCARRARCGCRRSSGWRMHGQPRVVWARWVIKRGGRGRAEPGSRARPWGGLQARRGASNWNGTVCAIVRTNSCPGALGWGAHKTAHKPRARTNPGAGVAQNLGQHCKLGWANAHATHLLGG